MRRLLSAIVVPFTALRSARAAEFPPFELVPTSDVTRVCDFYAILQAVVSWVLVIGLIIGVLFVVWGGISYITAAGDEQKMDRAKSVIIGSLAGVVFLILSVALIKIIADFFGARTFTISLRTVTCP